MAFSASNTLAAASACRPRAHHGGAGWPAVGWRPSVAAQQPRQICALHARSPCSLRLLTWSLSCSSFTASSRAFTKRPRRPCNSSDEPSDSPAGRAQHSGWRQGSHGRSPVPSTNGRAKGTKRGPRMLTRRELGFKRSNPGLRRRRTLLERRQRQCVHGRPRRGWSGMHCSKERSTAARWRVGARSLPQQVTSLWLWPRTLCR